MVAIVDLDDEVRGDTLIYDLTISRAGAIAGWMTGGTLLFMAKLKVSDADADAVFTKSTPASGIVWGDQSAASPTAVLTIGTADYTDLLPGKEKLLHYEVEATESNGRRETVQKGTLKILADVVRGA